MRGQREINTIKQMNQCTEWVIAWNFRKNQENDTVLVLYKWGRRGNILGISSAVGSLLELFRDCFFVDVDGVVADPPLAMVAETSLCDLDTE